MHLIHIVETVEFLQFARAGQCFRLLGTYLCIPHPIYLGLLTGGSWTIGLKAGFVEFLNSLTGYVFLECMNTRMFLG